MGSQGLPGKFPIHRAGALFVSSNVAYAFELYLLDGFIRVRAGTVNAIPVSGVDTDIEPANGLKIWIHVDVDEAGITTAANIASGSDYPEDDEDNGHQPLGGITVTGEIVTLPPVIVRGGLRHRMCNGTHDFWALAGGA